MHANPVGCEQMHTDLHPPLRAQEDYDVCTQSGLLLTGHFYIAVRSVRSESCARTCRRIFLKVYLHARSLESFACNFPDKHTYTLAFLQGLGKVRLAEIVFFGAQLGSMHATGTQRPAAGS